MNLPTHGRLRVDAGSVRVIDARVDGVVLKVKIDGVAVEAAVRAGSAGEVLLDVGGRRVRAVVARDGERWLVSIGGAAHVVSRVEAGTASHDATADEPFAVSPMTGVVAKVHVKPGDRVEKGAALFAVEAMKMEYVVRAGRDVAISAVRSKAGDRVSLGDAIVDFGATPSS